jgi:serine/threonine protein kinase
MGEQEPINIDSVFQIQYTLSFTTDGFKIPLDALPKQYIDGTLRSGSRKRCSIRYRDLKGKGGYGNIYLAKRVDPSGSEIDVCVKVSHIVSHSLCPEAIIQWLAYSSLATANIVGAIPRVYDIFQYVGETRFSMSFVDGISSIDYILASSKPGETLLQILVQTSALLAFLEEKIHLDHRDLKADNIWIRQEPINYTLSIGGTSWHITAPFQVVLLDFGFSCLGSSENIAVVSLSCGILPLVDPCPKEGRDLFQLISSLWSIPQIRSSIDSEVSSDIELLLSYRNKPYTNLIVRTIDINWVYLLVSDSKFKHPPLHPISLLERLSIKYPQLKIQKT